MSFFTRSATFAALPIVGGLLALTTTPGFASDLAKTIDRPVLASVPLNAPITAAVPVATDATIPQTMPQALIRPAMIQAIPETPEVETQAERDYASLAAAVAAQHAGDLDRELNCLAVGVYFESKGEPLAGQLAVAHTILNRTRSGRFPKSVCSVLTQRGQFSFVRGGVVPQASGRAGWKTAAAIAKVAANELWDSAAPKALFVHARRVSPGWRMARVATIGNHIFYR